jgi:hypothetical protein
MSDDARTTPLGLFNYARSLYAPRVWTTEEEKRCANATRRAKASKQLHVLTNALTCHRASSTEAWLIAR